MLFSLSKEVWAEKSPSGTANHKPNKLWNSDMIYNQSLSTTALELYI